MKKWIPRQFIDSFRRKPLTFKMRNVSTGEVAEYDLMYLPGDVAEIGTYLNKGYWQPIEAFLHSCDDEAIVNLLYQLSIKTKFLSSINKSLSTYAPIKNAKLINPSSNAPPPNENSSIVSTGRHIHLFLEMQKLPPKPVPVFKAAYKTSVMESLARISVSWHDPEEFIFDNIKLAGWTGTRVVYRTDRFPQNENDGTVLVETASRDRYRQSAYVIDATFNVGTTLYICAFPAENGKYNRKVIANSKVMVGQKSITKLSFAARDLAASADGNGNVLFGGGQSDTTDEYISNVDKIYPDGTRQSLQNLQIARQYLVASTDGNGNVLFGGGFGGLPSLYSNAVDRYTPAGSQSRLTPLSVHRYMLTASADGNGNVLFIGGYNGTYLTTVDKYNSDGVKVNSQQLKTPRRRLASSTDGKGNVLCAGGKNASGPSNAVEAFSKDGIRYDMLPLTASSEYISAATDGNGDVLFCLRGEVVNKYTKDGVRTVLENAGTNILPAAATDGNGNALFGNSYATVSYDKKGNRTALAPLYTERSSLAAATDGNGNVLFGGGANNGSYIDKYFAESM